ncbi:7825_t:CDS:2 [Acaulospora colombiana]|uniref:7825_t:CDS:1 n=1 Tax=Acaulospora colombiana TaxID=27376 RepID=A0ACA9MU82_9GLOM|nr:7825_t:CDS:2 [Acaulospora colombiana]
MTGADITDYFNYGFNEYTWKAYCAKQKQMREDQHSRKKIHVYESKQEMNNLPPELQSISQSQAGLDHPSPQPTIMDGHQNDDYGMESGGYPQDFQGPPMGMGMFPPPDMQMGPHPPFFMGNPDIPPSGPMGFDHAYRGGQGMRNMNNMGNMIRPTGMPGGMPGMATRMPPTMPGGGMPTGGMPGMPRGMPGGMVGRGRGMAMDERPFFSMDDQSWEIENRNTQPYRPVFQGRPPTGPMHGAGVNRSDYNDWEHSPPPDAPFAHRLRPPFRTGAPPTGPADHRGLSASVESPSSDRGEEERSGDNRSASGTFFIVTVYLSCITIYCLYGKDRNNEPDEYMDLELKRSKLNIFRLFFWRLRAEDDNDNYSYVPLSSLAVVDEDDFSEVCVKPVFSEKPEVEDITADSNF